MTRVVAVANQKGGVAKTTTVHALGSALSARGHHVLVVDLDPQACLTYALGFDPEALSHTVHDVVLGRNTAAEVVVATGALDVLPSSVDLAGSELYLHDRAGREHVLARSLRAVQERYDVVLIDCPPTLGVLTVNALTAARWLIVPLQCEALAHRGVAQLLDTVADVRELVNPDLGVLGAIATMFDGRTRHAREVLADVREHFGITVLEPPVPKSIRFAEAPAHGRSILEHAPRSPGAEAYRRLAAEIANRLGLVAPLDEAEPPRLSG